jgi:hypothetical protein
LVDLPKEQDRQSLNISLQRLPHTAAELRLPRWKDTRTHCLNFVPVRPSLQKLLEAAELASQPLAQPAIHALLQGAILPNLEKKRPSRKEWKKRHRKTTRKLMQLPRHKADRNMQDSRHEKNVFRKRGVS